LAKIKKVQWRARWFTELDYTS